MLWGYFFTAVLKKRVKVDGMMDRAKRDLIQEENLLETVKDWILGWRFTFQQGNGTNHKACRVTRPIKSIHPL